MASWPAAHGLSREELQAVEWLSVVSGREVLEEAISPDLLWGGVRPWGALGIVGHRDGACAGVGTGLGPQGPMGCGVWREGIHRHIRKPAVVRVWGKDPPTGPGPYGL